MNQDTETLQPFAQRLLLRGFGPLPLTRKAHLFRRCLGIPKWVLLRYTRTHTQALYYSQQLRKERENTTAENSNEQISKLLHRNIKKTLDWSAPCSQSGVVRPFHAFLRSRSHPYNSSKSCWKSPQRFNFTFTHSEQQQIKYTRTSLTAWTPQNKT